MGKAKTGSGKSGKARHVCVYASGDLAERFAKEARAAGKTMSGYMIDAADTGIGGLPEETFRRLRAMALVSRVTLPELIKKIITSAIS